MSAAGSQLALMLLDERDQKGKAATDAASAAAQKPANAGQLPPGSLENAFERAKARLAMSSEQDAA